MKLIKFLSSIIPIITAIIMFVKGIINYLKNNPESKLKIFSQSIVTSIATFMIIYGIAAFYYGYFELTHSKHFRMVELIAILLVTIITIIITPMYLVKDWYKIRYAFVIAEDYKLFNKDQKNFTRYAKTASEDLANDFINNTLNSSVKLDKINSLRNNNHRLSKITKRFDKLSITTWFVLPLLALNMYILIFRGYEQKLEFIIISIIISVIFIICNSFVIYFDTKLRYGIVDQTDSMLKKHEKKYRKFLNNQKEKQRKEND